MDSHKERMADRRLSWLRWASLLIAGLAAVVWAGITTTNATSPESFTEQGSMAEREATDKANDLSRAFRMAAKRVLPAVVVIKTSSKPKPIEEVEGSGHLAPQGFQEMEDEEDSDWQNAQPEPGLASGVVIDSKGIVLTNNHVVEGADEVIVRLSDGRQFPAKIEKTDSRLDLAVLSVKSATPLPAARLGDSEAMEIGDWVLAVGCPFDLEQTVSAGIISAKGRSLESAGSARLLQTDAAINPGSSGGPLVNLRGEVVGITTAIASRSGGYQGIAFAVPTNIAKQLLTAPQPTDSSPSQSGRAGQSRNFSAPR